MNLNFTKLKSVKIASSVLLGLFLVVTVFNMCSPTIMYQFTVWNSFENVFFSIARWLSYLMVVTSVVAIIYKRKTYQFLSVFVATPMLIISLCSSYQYLNLFEISTFYVVTHFLFNVLGIVLGVYIFLDMIINKEDKSFWLNTFLKTLPLLILGLIPLNIFMQNNTLMNSAFLQYKIFGGWHLFFVLLAVACVFLLYFVLKRKSEEDAQNVMFVLSVVMVYQLLTRFSVVSTGSYHSLSNIFAALPLYLCSFGILILPFAIASKNKMFQTILFLANMPGAFVVFVYLDPGAGVSILHYNVTYFVFNHLLLFVVASLLPRFCNAEYKFKNLLHLFYILAIYLAVVSILNNVCILNGFDPNYSYVSFSPIPLGPIAEIGKFTIFGMTFAPLYLFILYLFYMAIFALGLCVYRGVLWICHKVGNKEKQNKTMATE